MIIGDGIVRKQCKRWDRVYKSHFLTFSCLGRQPFFSGKRYPIWFLDALKAARLKFGFHLWGYVVMPEHVHLLIFIPNDAKMSVILSHLKEPVTRQAIKFLKDNDPAFLRKMEIVKPDGKTAHSFWLPGGGYDRNLRSVADIHEKLNYLHQNPIIRGLVQRMDEWRWSSIHSWMTGTTEPVPLDLESYPQVV